MPLALTRLLHLLLRLGMVGALLSYWVGPMKGRLWIQELLFIALLLPAAYLDYHYFRCPHCGNHLKTMFPFPKSCPHCQEPLYKSSIIRAKDIRAQQDEWRKIHEQK